MITFIMFSLQHYTVNNSCGYERCLHNARNIYRLPTSELRARHSSDLLVFIEQHFPLFEFVDFNKRIVSGCFNRRA